MGHVEQDLADPDCWGLLVVVGGGQPGHPVGGVWRFTNDRHTYTLGRGNSIDIKIVSPVISKFASSNPIP